MRMVSRQAPKVAAAATTTSSAGLGLGSRGLSTTTPKQQEASILLQDKQDGFGFARHNPRPEKPRTRGVTEIRGPYYSVC